MSWAAAYEKLKPACDEMLADKDFALSNPNTPEEAVMMALRLLYSEYSGKLREKEIAQGKEPPWCLKGIIKEDPEFISPPWEANKKRRLLNDTQKVPKY